MSGFREQPLIHAIEADPALEERFTSDPAFHFDEDLETYVARHVAAVLSIPALLTLDGRWVEGGGPDYERMFSAYSGCLVLSSVSTSQCVDAV